MYKQKYIKYSKKNNLLNGGFICNPQIDHKIVNKTKNKMKYDGNSITGFSKTDIDGKHFIEPINDKDILGKGSYGSVYKGVKTTLLNEITNSNIIAIKEMDVINNNMHNSLCMELLAISNINHDNIIKYYGYANDGNKYYLFMQYIPGHQLLNYIDLYKNKNKYNTKYKLSFIEKVSITKQLLNALDYLHKKGIYHRDIKPENIMISDNDTKPFFIDFGFSCQENISCQYSKYEHGSPLYISPEFAHNIIKINENIKSKNISENIKLETRELYKYHDLWALGATLFYIFTGYPFFIFRQNQTLAIITKLISNIQQENIDEQIERYIPKIPVDINLDDASNYEYIRQVIINLLKKNPLERKIVLFDNISMIN
jgi:serine/threonine protein kinase